jgi:N-hydroxyarylamine O-acetyltransferase
VDVTAYLARIGADDGDPLDVLVERHLRSVPFENLSIHLGEPIVLDPASLFDKIVTRRRGGFCHELNGAFAWLLRELGHEVTLLGARVAGDEGFTAPLAHAALRVLDDGVPHLVDVGFGRFGVGPIDLTAPSPQLAPAEDGDLDVRSPAGETGYRLELHPRSREDFEPTCFWQSTHPDSWFTRVPVCSLPIDDGRVTMQGTTLLRTAGDGTRSEEQLGEQEALDAYRYLFGVRLDRLPTPLYPAG